MKKFKNILKAMCLILAVACMSFAFAGCGEKGGEGIYEISACKTAFTAHSYACYNLTSACNDTISVKKKQDEIAANESNQNLTAADKKQRNDALKREINKISATWGRLIYNDNTLYSTTNPEPDLTKIKVSSAEISNQFILDNVGKYDTSSFVAVNGGTQVYVIHLKNITDKFIDTTDFEPASFINNAKGSGNYTVAGVGERPQGKFGTNIVSVKNTSTDAEKINRFDVILGMNLSGLNGIYGTWTEYTTTTTTGNQGGDQNNE